MKKKTLISTIQHISATKSVIINIIVFFFFNIAGITAYEMGMTAMSFIMLSALSFLFFLEALAIFILNFSQHSGQSVKNNLLYPIIFLFLSVWTIRFNIGIHTDIFEVGLSHDATVTGLTPFEHYLNSFVHALQSFSMDEDYTNFITDGKKFILELPYRGSLLKIFAELYGIYCVILNALAPIAGGAILFDILTNLSPRLRLRTRLFLHPNTLSYVFSELNERSITIAESVHSDRPDSFIVFTDVYTSEDEEKPSELLIRAKKIGALCLKADLSILKRLSWGPVNYYLIDEAEVDNIESFAALSDTSSPGIDRFSFIDIWKEKNSFVQIYVFVDSPLVDQMIEHFNMICRQKELADVIAKPVNTPEQLSYEVIRKYPLYRSIIEAPEPDSKDSVSILIFGDSPFIRHFIKTSYWCGQMLNPYTLHTKSNGKPVHIHPDFHIIGPETENIKNYIASEMPSIHSEIDWAEKELTYASFHFHDVPLTRNSIYDMINKLKSIDYCITDTKNDLENIKLCHTVKKILDQRFLTHRQKADILCVVENSDLNQVNYHLNGVQEQYIRVHYIGSINEQYEINTIEKTTLEEEAAWIDQTHKEKPPKELYSNLYNYRSSLSSALHYQYKLFSAGVFLKKSEGYLSYDFEETSFTSDFLKQILGVDVSSNETQELSDYTLSQCQLLDSLLWLEKIRWNSFVKTSGYTVPLLSEVRSVYDTSHSYKLHGKLFFSNQSLPLHACLMDLCEPLGIVLNDLRKRDDYDKIKKELTECFLTEEFDTGTTWPDFLNYLLTHFDFGMDLDILDVFSILAECDYKEYDLKQIPTLAINKLLRKAPDHDHNIMTDRITSYLKMLSESDCYLAPQFKSILNTIQKTN